jgi:hypothetical protein
MTFRVILATAALQLVPRVALACPVCFGADDGPMLQGSNMGIAALLAVTVIVLGIFGGFFITLARRAARAVPDTPVFDVSPAPDGQGR